MRIGASSPVSIASPVVASTRRWFTTRSSVAPSPMPPRKQPMDSPVKLPIPKVPQKIKGPNPDQPPVRPTPKLPPVLSKYLKQQGEQVPALSLAQLRKKAGVK